MCRGRRHYQLVVRQKISSRKTRQEAKLRSHPGGEVWRAARDQIAVNPATGSGRADRWPGGTAGNNSKRECASSPTLIQKARHRED